MNFLQPVRFAKNLLVASAMIACANAAHASTIVYNLTGVTTSAGTLTGTLSLNSVTDMVTAANITFNDAAVGNPVYNLISYSNAYNALDQSGIVVSVANPPVNFGGQLLLYFNTANVGTGNLSICTASILCGTQGGSQTSTVQAYVSGNNGGPFAITAGSLNPVGTPAPTPEPSSLLLLGTGLCSVAGMARRKFLA